MQIGDLVRHTPESWGTPLEDRPLGIVIKGPYTHTAGDKSVVVDVQFPDDEHTYAVTPNNLETLSEVKTFI